MGLSQKIETIWNLDRAYAIRYLIVFAGSVFVHTVLAILFAMFREPLCMWMNILSILVYFLWLCAFGYIRVTTVMLLVPYFDVVIHAGFYNLIFGPEPAFFLYPFVLIPITFFLPVRDSTVKHPLVISSILAVFGIMSTLATLSASSASPIPALSECFFQVNILVCSLLLGIHTWEFLTDANYSKMEIRRSVEYDQLTGLQNRISLNRDTASIHGSQYCVIMCDVDNFRDVNNTYGYTVGDTMLSLIGRALHACLRREDLVCRWGGECFLMVIRSDMEAARAAADRIRRKILSVATEVNGEPVSVTMTFGIADCMEEDSFEKVVAIAQDNMLQGKRCGKNCIFTSASDPVHFSAENPETELDTSDLDSPIFSAFAATSDTTYLYICNMETNVSRWSRSAVDYFGLPGEYMYDAGNLWMGYVHPEDRDGYAADIKLVLSGKKRFHDVTYRARNKNGEYVTCVCKGVVTDGGPNHPPLFAGTMTNLGISPHNGRTGK